MKVASIGECMVELSDAGAGSFCRAFGGDTLNTALYLARLGVETSYVTALGDDPLSGIMLDAWSAEGINIDEVVRLPGRLPGLYMIERDTLGERSFLYWRDRAPAREFFDLVDDLALERLAHFDWLYLSGITLSLYSDRGRARLIELLTKARRNGGLVAFDGNYRPRGWSDAAAARRFHHGLTDQSGHAHALKDHVGTFACDLFHLRRQRLVGIDGIRGAEARRHPAAEIRFLADDHMARTKELRP